MRQTATAVPFGQRDARLDRAVLGDVQAAFLLAVLFLPPAAGACPHRAGRRACRARSRSTGEALACSGLSGTPEAFAAASTCSRERSISGLAFTRPKPASKATNPSSRDWRTGRRAGPSPRHFAPASAPFQRIDLAHAAAGLARIDAVVEAVDAWSATSASSALASG